MSPQQILIITVFVAAAAVYWSGVFLASEVKAMPNPPAASIPPSMPVWREKLCEGHAAITKAFRGDRQRQDKTHIFSALGLSPQDLRNTDNSEYLVTGAWRVALDEAKQSPACKRDKRGENNKSKGANDNPECNERKDALVLAAMLVENAQVQAWWMEQDDKWEEAHKRNKNKGPRQDEKDKKDKGMTQAVNSLCG